MADTPAQQSASGTGSPPEGPPPFAFDAVRRRELEREKLWQQDDPKRPDGAVDRVGLCLSGGGIRSAAFCLGVIQLLHNRDILKRVDYLSTVSGGGYLGASLMAARLRAEMTPDGKPVLKADGQTPVEATFPFDVQGDSPETGQASDAVGIRPQDIADTAAVRALRDHSRFLIPHGAWDVFLSAGQLIRGIVVNLLLLAPYLLALAAFLLASLGPLQIRGPAAPDLPLPWTSGLAAAYAAVFGVAWAIAVSKFRSEPPRWENRSRWARMAAICLIPLLAVAGLESLVGLAGSILSSASPAAGASPGLTWFGGDLQIGGPGASFRAWSRPPVAETIAATGTGSATLGWLTALLGTAIASLGVLWKRLGGLIQGASTDPAVSATVKAIIARIVGFLLALALPALLCVLVLLLVELGRSGEPASLSADRTRQFLFWSGALLSVGWIGYRLSSARFRPSASEAISLLPSVLALAALAWAPTTAPVLLSLYVILTAALHFVAELLLVNATSLHRLYRDRLEEGFALGWAQPGTTNGPAPAITPVTLTDLANFYDLTDSTTNSPRKRPYLIANMTLNLSGSKQKNMRNRNADFFTVTADHVGSDATGYRESTDYTLGSASTAFVSPAERLDLGTVAAASGAAVGSRMGRTGFALFAPTLALLNIRLGLWLRNPKMAPGAGQKAGSKAGLTLLDEITGALDEDKSLLYLTDGGHIDNLGLYQLLKRRCDLIICVDAEADPAMACGALVDVERLARIDLGVLLDIRIDPLRDAALSRRAGLFTRAPGAPAPVSDPSCHAIISRIHYPEQTPVTSATGDAPPKLKEKTGILVYIKTALTGDEPSYVLDYERRHPTFPHETTGDQFFSEDQFEAYRALGFHAARDALRQDGENADRSDLLDNLFRRLGVPRQDLGRGRGPAGRQA